MNHGGEGAEPDLANHRDRNLVDHVPSVACDYRGSENLVGAFLDVDFDEPLFLSVSDGAIHVFHRHTKGIDLNPPFLRVLFIHAHMRDLRVGVGAPWDRERAEFLTAKEQRVLNDNTRGGVGGMGELVVHANIARRVDAGVRRL